RLLESFEAADAFALAEAVDVGTQEARAVGQRDVARHEQDEARRERGVGEAEVAAQVLLAAGELALEKGEGLVDLVLGAAEPIGVPLRRGLRVLDQIRARGQRERVVRVVLQQPDAGATGRVALGQERRLRVLVLEILVDDGGDVDDRTAFPVLLVDEYRHLVKRVQCQEVGRVLLVLPQVHQNHVVIELLFGQDDARLLTEWTLRVVVQLQHSPPPKPLVLFDRGGVWYGKSPTGATELARLCELQRRDLGETTARGRAKRAGEWDPCRALPD